MTDQKPGRDLVPVDVEHVEVTKVQETPAPEKKNRQWIRQLVDFGALAAFMISYFVTRDMIFATWVLVGASALALVVGYAVERRFAPLPLITGLFALVFGLLTVFTLSLIHISEPTRPY